MVRTLIWFCELVQKVFFHRNCILKIAFILVVFKVSNTIPMTCDFRSHYWKSVGLQECCMVKNIDSNDTSIEMDGHKQSVGGFVIEDNFKLKNLPQTLSSQLPDLVAYEVSGTAAKSVEYSHFQNQREMLFVNLTSNHLETVSVDAFKDCIKLKFLVLRFNRIRTLPADIFARLLNIHGISLTSNKLVELPSDLLRHNPKLKEFHARNNAIELVDASMFDHLSLLNRVRMHGNICIQKQYAKDAFATMKSDLTAKCSYKYDEIGRLRAKELERDQQFNKEAMNLRALEQEIQMMKETNENLVKTLEMHNAVIADQTQKIAEALQREKEIREQFFLCQPGK